MNHEKYFSQKLRKVPEVQGSCRWAELNPEEFGDICTTYVEIIGRLVDWTDNDIKMVKEANQTMRKRSVRETSASNLRADVFLDSLDADKRNSLRDVAAQAFNPESPFFGESLSQLADMMYQGHEMFASGGTPRDGDSASDSVIWGHTQAREDVEPAVLAHFTVCHYLARFFTHALGTTELTQDKDAFLAVLIDVVLLEEAKKPGSTKVLDIWLTSKESGGLGWLVQEQVDAYRDVVLSEE